MSHERRVPWTTWRDIEGDAKSPLRAALSSERRHTKGERNRGLHKIAETATFNHLLQWAFS